MCLPNKFIKATEEFTTFERHIPAPYFRKSFFIKEKTVARILIGVCGFYDLFLNGKKITKGFLAPYISNTDDVVYYDEYTVELQKDENVIGIQLGNGFQNNPAGYIWEFDKSDFRSAPSFALSLTFKDENGNEVVIESGTDFKTAPSPIIFDDYRFGEIYDANLELNGWNNIGFDDTNWQDSINAATPKGEPRICEAEPIVFHEEKKPVSITKQGNTYIYDFGINNTGLCKLTVKGEKGQRIELQHAEQIFNGELDLKSVWFDREMFERDKEFLHKDVYVCKGEDSESYMPTFTYHGFRYVAVSGITDEQATEDLLTYIIIHSDIKVSGGFSTSDKTVNALQEITMRSNLSNFHYFPTDCPHREKNGWTADAALSAEQMNLNLSVQNSFREWVRNICKAQNENGALPGIVPTGGWGIEWGNGPAWDCVLIYLPYYTYIYKGDTQIVKEAAESIYKYLRYLDTREDSDGLLAIGLGDWCHVGRDPEQPKAPLIVTDSIVTLDLAQKSAFLFDVIGMNDRRNYALEKAEKIRASIRKNLVDFDTFTVKGDCQSSQAMAIYYGVFNDDEKQYAFDKLLSLINQADSHMDVGVLGGRVLFHVLADFGYCDLALKMITRPDFPSYGNWLERGATTLWEMFLEKENAYSKNHHFWGDISAWFIKHLAGINYNPCGKDHAEVNICPNFVSQLNDASAFYDSCFGRIESYWARKDSIIKLNVVVPNGVKGEIILPNGYVFIDRTRVKDVASGSYEIILAD